MHYRNVSDITIKTTNQSAAGSVEFTAWRICNCWFIEVANTAKLEILQASLYSFYYALL